MAEFTANLQSLKPSFPLMDIDANVDFIGQIGGLNPSVIHDPNVNLLDNMPILFNENFFANQAPAKFPENWGENFPEVFYQGTQMAAPSVEPTLPSGNELQGSKKRKLETDAPESSSGNSTPQISKTGAKSKNSSGKGKKSRKGNEKEEEKPREVVHVRARRGQATDSHSVAERIRRGKINERLRCLQDIVPGCYKTMGMAVMLDEIINYVQSLQNQVEFLSMKLTAASSFYDFNYSDSNAAEKMKRAEGSEAKAMREGNGGLLLASTQLGSFDLSFGPYSTLPFNNI